MEGMKKLIIGLVVGLAIGLWIGVNIGKNKPVWSNPFDQKKVQKRIKEKGGQVIEKGAKLLEEKGRKLQGKD